MPFSPTLRYLQKTMLAGSVDSDINYMAVLVFHKCLDLRKMSILGQAPSDVKRYLHSWVVVVFSAPVFS